MKCLWRRFARFNSLEFECHRPVSSSEVYCDFHLEIIEKLESEQVILV